MKTTFPERIAKEVRIVSKTLGIEEKEVMTNALRYYLDALSPYLDLRKEMEAWDQLSEDAFLRFERSL